MNKFIEELNSSFPDMNIINSSTYMIEIDQSNCNDTLKLLQKEFNFISLVDISLNKTEIYDLYYIVLNLELQINIIVSVKLTDFDNILSINNLWENAYYFEEELTSIYNIKFIPLKVIPIDPVLNETLIPFSVLPDNLKVPANLEFLFKLSGELVKSVNIKSGFIRKNVEEIMKDSHVLQIENFITRLDYHNLACNSVIWYNMLESISAIEIPDRAKAIRMIFIEVSRVVSHINGIIKIFSSTGYNCDIHLLYKMKSSLNYLFQSFSTGGMFCSPSILGGVRKDITKIWTNECFYMLKHILKHLSQINKKIINSKIWHEKTKIGRLSGHNAIEYGVTGPALRASGINYDIRKLRPIYFYKDVTFDVPLGVYGQCYDRYLVMYEEIQQSVIIINQILDNIPSGDIIAEQFLLNHFKEDDIDSSHFEKHVQLIENGISIENKIIYSSYENACGEFGFLFKTNKDNKIEHIKIKSSASSVIAVMPKLLGGLRMTDVSTVYQSFNVAPGEQDR